MHPKTRTEFLHWLNRILYNLCRGPNDATRALQHKGGQPLVPADGMAALSFHNCWRRARAVIEFTFPHRRGFSEVCTDEMVWPALFGPRPDSWYVRASEASHKKLRTQLMHCEPEHVIMCGGCSNQRAVVLPQNRNLQCKLT